jgi:predicted metal-dependent phosphoesterase TrpH
MPRLDPFTALCQQAARRPGLDRADLHLHTVHSDGAYTPAQVVELALRSGLCAVAITDHDTLAGVEPARQAADGTGLEVIPGVEITAEHDGRELHLLAYFVSPQSIPLLDALRRLRELRQVRFRSMIDRLRGLGIAVDEASLPACDSLGRRHLAELLVQTRQVASVREAFQRYLHDGGRADVPKQRMPIHEALSCVRAAGGVSAWAHPPENCARQDLTRLRALGLGAVEAVYPGSRGGGVRELKALAVELGLGVTGGSDCHGPDSPRRAVGACTISREELEALRERAQADPSSTGPSGS